MGGGAPAISLSERHGLILASDGSLWSWGSDFLGWPVLGLGKERLKSTSLRRVGHDTNWTSISASADFNLAIKSDGTMWTWGASKTTQHTGMTVIYAPIQAAGDNDWKQAATGGDAAVALKRNGTLWAWGNNWAGSVGIASTNGSNTPVQIGSATNWTRVWAATLETLGLQSDGSLWYWGDNLDPSYPQGKGQTFTPTRVNGDTNWMDVGFGAQYCFSPSSPDGTLWVWGRNADRYTGATNPAQDTIPMRLGKDSDWRTICATSDWWITGLIKKDGSLWVMDASRMENQTDQRFPPQPDPIPARGVRDQLRRRRCRSRACRCTRDAWSDWSALETGRRSRNLGHDSGRSAHIGKQLAENRSWSLSIDASEDARR